MRPKLKSSRTRPIVNAYLAGVKPADIAESVNLSKRRVHQIVAEKLGKRRIGRPRVHVPECDKALYAKIRRHYGAAQAKVMMGLPL